MYESNKLCSTKRTLWKMKVFLIAHWQFTCDRFNSSLNWTNRLKTIWMTVFSTQAHFLIVSIVAKLNIPVTKESVPTGRWWALHSAFPGLLTAITEFELRVNRPSSLEGLLHFLHFFCRSLQFYCPQWEKLTKIPGFSKDSVPRSSLDWVYSG